MGLTFHINKMVDTGSRDKKTKQKKIENVRVPASVQMWIIPGQEKALEARSKALVAVSKDMDKLTQQKKETMAKNIPKIKSIAVFRSEGNSEAKYLFAKILFITTILRKNQKVYVTVKIAHFLRVGWTIRSNFTEISTELAFQA